PNPIARRSSVDGVESKTKIHRSMFILPDPEQKCACLMAKPLKNSARQRARIPSCSALFEPIETKLGIFDLRRQDCTNCPFGSFQCCGTSAFEIQLRKIDDEPQNILVGA